MDLGFLNTSYMDMANFNLYNARLNQALGAAQKRNAAAGTESAKGAQGKAGEVTEKTESGTERRFDDYLSGYMAGLYGSGSSVFGSAMGYGGLGAFNGFGGYNMLASALLGGGSSASVFSSALSGARMRGYTRTSPYMEQIMSFPNNKTTGRV